MGMTTTDVRSVAHACAVPISDEQLWEMSAAFLSAGLSAGEQVVYFDDGTAEAVLERLVDDRVPVRRPLADGQLTVVDGAETRRALRAPVRDAAASMTALIDGAVEAGWTGLRWTGQFSAGLRPTTSGVWLADHDAAVDAAIAGRPARVLCLFDRHRFPDEAIEQLRALHRIELDAPAVYDDNQLRITRRGPFHLRLAGEVDQSNRPVVLRMVVTALDEALRSHSAPTALEFDLSSLRFLDVAGATLLVHAAEEFPESHRLALHGVRPGVLRVLERCGASFAAQLDITPHPGNEFARPDRTAGGSPHGGAGYPDPFGGTS
jgi:ABC-type transporter Mla MlaB component